MVERPQSENCRFSLSNLDFSSFASAEALLKNIYT